MRRLIIELLVCPPAIQISWGLSHIVKGGKIGTLLKMESWKACVLWSVTALSSATYTMCELGHVT